MLKKLRLVLFLGFLLAALLPAIGSASHHQLDSYTAEEGVQRVQGAVSAVAGITLLLLALLAFPADKMASCVNFVVAGSVAAGVARDAGLPGSAILSAFLFAGLAGSLQASAGRLRVPCGVAVMLLMRLFVGGCANLLAQTSLHALSLNPFAILAGGLGAVVYGITSQVLRPYRKEYPSIGVKGSSIPEVNHAFERTARSLGIGPFVLGCMNAAIGAMASMWLQEIASSLY